MAHIRKLWTFIKNHPRLTLALAILVSACVVYYQYIFGDSIFLFNDIGSDTQQQYIMQYSSVANHLADGNLSFWDFTNGFGTSMLQLNLFDPSLIFLYVAGALFGPGSIAYLLIYIHIAKMILAGLMCFQFLSCFSFSRKARVLASYLYAFSGFLMVWGQHYQFSIITVYLPLFLYLLEMALRKKRFAPSLAIISACVVINNYYTGYMILLAAGIYLIVRLFFMETSALRGRIALFFRSIGTMILGVGISLCTLLPSLLTVTGVSSRLESGASIFERIVGSVAPYSSTYYTTLIQRFFSSNLEGIGNAPMPYTGYTNYYEAPSVFFSTLFIVLAAQFLFCLIRSRETFRRKLTQWILVLLTGILLLVPTGSLAFNGFVSPFSRHTFVLLPLFALLTARMTDKILREKFFSFTGAVLSAAAMIFIYYRNFKTAPTDSSKLNVLILCGSGVLMLLLLFLASRKWSGRRLPSLLRPAGIYCLLALCTAVNVMSDAHITARGRSSVAKGSEEYFGYLYNTDMETLLDYVEQTDPEFVRLEKTAASASYCLESCAQNYRGVSTYNSTLNKNIMEFVEKLLPKLNLVNYAHLSYRQITGDDVFAALFGIRYLVTDTPDYESDTWELVQQSGELYLYRNRCGASLGRLYTQTVSASDYEEQAASIAPSKLLTQAVIVDEAGSLSMPSENLAEYESLELPNYLALSDESLLKNPELSEGSLYLSGELSLSLDGELSQQQAPVTMSFEASPAAQPAEIRFSTNNGSSDTAGYTLTADGSRTVYSVTLTIPADSKTLQIDSDVECTFSNIRFSSQGGADEFAPDSGVTVENTGNDSYLSGTISADSDSFAFFAIPYEQGWSATLDGEPVELVRADYGFTGFYVTSGNHTFTFAYRVPGLAQGGAVSLVCLGLLAALTLCSRKRKVSFRGAAVQQSGFSAG